jgi:hypothetical protein
MSLLTHLTTLSIANLFDYFGPGSSRVTAQSKSSSAYYKNSRSSGTKSQRLNQNLEFSFPRLSVYLCMALQPLWTLAGFSGS